MVSLVADPEWPAGLAGGAERPAGLAGRAERSAGLAGDPELADGAERTAGFAGDPAPAAEPAQPVYTRYWLHGKGPAPAGNLPVAVHVRPGRTALPASGAATLRVTVACGLAPAAGQVELDVPPGLRAAPDRPLRYDLPPGGHAGWDLAVSATPETRAGRYFVAARIRDGLGHCWRTRRCSPWASRAAPT